MAKELNSLSKAGDNLNQTIKKVNENVNKLYKNIKNSKKQTLSLNYNVKLDIKGAKKQLNLLSKEFKKHEKIGVSTFKKQAESFSRTTEGIRKLTSEYQSLNELQQKVSRSTSNTIENGRNYKSKGKSDNNIGKSLKGLANSDVVDKLGSAISHSVGQSISSTYGASQGRMVSNVGGGAISGAIAGSVFGPVGTAVGGLIGAVTGFIQAKTEEIKEMDDLFRDEVKNIYEKYVNSVQDHLKPGIQLASQNEQNDLTFETLMGSKNKAKRFIKQAENLGVKTTYSKESILNTSKNLLQTGLKPEEILPLIDKVGEAGAALGMKPEEMDMVASTLGKMQMGDKASLQFLDPLIQKGIPAVDYLAKAFNKTNEEVKEMLNKGLIPGAEASKIIAKNMEKEFQGSMDKRSNSFQGLSNNLEEAKGNIDAAMGKAYNDKRKEGIEYEMSQYTGEAGEEMKKMFGLIGEYQADLKNNQEKGVLDAMKDAMNSDEYIDAKAEGNGAKMGEILAKAKAEAEIKFKNTEEYQMQLDAQLGLAKKIQEDVALNGKYVDFGKKMAEQFSIGWSGAVNLVLHNLNLTKEEKEKAVKEHGNWFQKAAEKNKNNTDAYLMYESTPTIESKHNYGYWNHSATGLRRVPYNNYPAMLHENERVLTAQEAKAYNKNPQVNNAPSFNITVHNNGSSPYEVTKEICDKILRASEGYGGVYPCLSSG